MNNFYHGDGSLIPIYKGFILYLLTFILQWFRNKSKNFFVFTVGHILLILMSFLLGSNLIEKWIYALLTSALVISSFKLYLSEIKNAFGIPLLVAGESIFFLVFLFNLYMKYSIIQPFLNSFSLVYILLFMVYMHILNIDTSLEIITKNSIQPVSQIKSFNNKIIGLFLFLVAVILMICPYLHIQDLIKLLGQGLLTFIRFLFSLGKHEEQLPPVGSEEPLKPNGSDQLILPKGETNPLITFIEEILIYVVDIAVVIGIIALICYALYQLYKNFYANSSSANETKEFISPLLKTEKTNIGFNPFKKILASFNATNNEKIRKIYSKKVNQYTRLGLKVSNDTATEISTTAKTSINKDISELTTYYEKARYSNIEASKEDLINVKTLSNRNN
jgi:hypothetical protein